MMRFLKPSFLVIPAGLAIGLLAAATVVDTEPAFLGWVMCAGLGLMGGSFVAAISSGEQLVSGPAPKRGSVSSAPWLTPSPTQTEDEGDEDPREESREGR